MKNITVWCSQYNYVLTNLTALAFRSTRTTSEHAKDPQVWTAKHRLCSESDILWSDVFMWHAYSNHFLCDIWFKELLIKTQALNSQQMWTKTKTKI